MSRGILTQFRTQTLDNGTTYQALTTVTTSGRAEIHLTALPDGSLYDHDQSITSRVRPQQRLVADVLLNFDDGATAQAAYKTIEALVGLPGALTMRDMVGSATKTCTARLESVEDVTRYDKFAAERIQARLTFVPTTAWS